MDILDMDLEEAKKTLVETLKATDKEQLFKDLVSCGLLKESIPFEQGVNYSSKLEIKSCKYTNQDVFDQNDIMEVAA